MGAKTTTSSNNYYIAKDFKFKKTVKEPTSISREETLEDKVYHVENYIEVSGRLASMRIVQEGEGKKEYKTLNVSLFDNGTYENVRMYMGSNESESFLNRLINIDLSKDIILKIFKQEKQKDGVGINEFRGLICVYQQNGESSDLVKFKFTKDDKDSDYGSLPDIEQVGTANNPSWNSSKRADFWENLINVKNAEIREVYKKQKEESKPVPTAEEMQAEADRQKAEAEAKHKANASKVSKEPPIRKTGTK